MEPWKSKRGFGYLPGTESKWEAYWDARDPYDRAAHYLRQGSVEFLDDALAFLSDRPRFLGSGYIAERMLRFLSRPDFSPRDRQRVIRVAEAIADEGYTREAWEAKRLLVRLEVPGRSAVRGQGAGNSTGARIDLTIREES